MTDLNFDLPKEQSSIIKVIGVGGGGSNAVNHMFNEGIVGVNFVVCNTDGQALDISPIPNKIQLGPELTQGLGAGSDPEVGRVACEESMPDIEEILSKNTKMVFVTAGMGGGTGTGAAPVIARIAREMGILTVGIVTTPFSFEGRRKLRQADDGIQRLKEHVDTILIISNDKIREMYGDLTKSEAFGHADNILATAAKSISEIITVPGEINVDFADVQYVMSNSGVAIMGAATAEGDDRALRAVKDALSSPLLNDNDIRGAKHVLINISSGHEQVTIDEITEISDYVQEAAGNNTDIIFGTCDDDTLGDKLSVTIIATGFDATREGEITNVSDKVVHRLNDHKESTAAPKKEEKVEETEEVQEVKEEDESSAPVDDSLDSDDEDLNFTVKRTEQPKEEKPEEPKLSFYTSKGKESKKMEEDDVEERAKESDKRKRILKDLSYKWGNPNSIHEMENEPAYKRRGVELDEKEHSSDNEVSRFTLSENENARPEIRKNNSFLHDNVD
jgi:cell division protein FtsZ